MKEFLALKLLDAVFIMLINFNIYEQDKFRAHLSWAWKSFIASGQGLNIGIIS